MPLNFSAHQRRLVAAIVTGAFLALNGCTINQSSSEAPDPGAQLARARELITEAQEADRQGDKKRAIELYQMAVMAYRDFPAAWNNMGALLMEQEKMMEAAEALRVAAELSPRDPRPHYNLGLIWQKLGYFEEASKYFTQAIDRDPNYLPALRESVVIDVQQDRITEGTAENIRKALQLETEDAWKVDLARRKLIIDGRLATMKDSVAH